MKTYSKKGIFLAGRESEFAQPAALAKELSGGRWRPAKHLQFLGIRLAELAAGAERFQIISIPPRHGKSEFISKYFPVWYLTLFPERRIILISYAAEFARNFSRSVRDIIEESGERLSLELKRGSRRAGEFALKDYGGGMFAVGAGGSITGRGADLLIIDDPIKNNLRLHKPDFMRGLLDWFRSTAYTRLEPNGAAILVMTRWSEDDLAGELAKRGDKWKALSLPAFASKNDPLGREEGRALWPERFDEDKLGEFRAELGSYWFEAMYQQSPQPRSGAAFRRKDLRYFESEGSVIRLLSPGCRLDTAGGFAPVSLGECKIIAAVDLAVKIGERNDYTACAVAAIAPKGEIALLKMIRLQLEAADHLEFLKKIFDDWAPSAIGVESSQYQLSLVQSARRAGLPVKDLRPKGDKFARSLDMAARVEAGTVYLLKEADWLDTFESELLSFPNGAHDDQVDAFCYLTYMLRPSGGVSPIGVSRKELLG